MMKSILRVPVLMVILLIAAPGYRFLSSGSPADEGAKALPRFQGFSLRL